MQIYLVGCVYDGVQPYAQKAIYGINAASALATSLTSCCSLRAGPLISTYFCLTLVAVVCFRMFVANRRSLSCVHKQRRKQTISRRQLLAMWLKRKQKFLP